jgi:hypothetical protein
MLLLQRLFQGAMLLTLTVSVHAVVLGMLLRHVERVRGRLQARFISYAWLLVRVAIATIAAHLVEIALWAGFYIWHGLMPDFETGFYFSAVTYATIGYGDIVLKEPWRFLAAVEGLTGILMCSWSAAFSFAVITRLYERTRAGA